MHKKKEKEEVKKNLSLETLVFLSSKLDEIMGKSELINELLEEEDDPKFIELLDAKLSKLESEIEYIGNKIRIEQDILKKSK